MNVPIPNTVKSIGQEIQEGLPLIRKLLEFAEAFNWRDLTGGHYKKVYGAFLEEHFTPSGVRLPDKSILYLRPESTLFWMKRGLVLEGICFKGSNEMRKFGSLEIKILNTDPLTVDYSYSATQRGSSFFQRGYIRFSAKAQGKYEEAEGEFVLPPTSERSLRKHHARIAFQWKRIPVEQIRTLIGKSAFDSFDDVRKFKQRYV